jgi:hypothetical protein
MTPTAAKRWDRATARSVGCISLVPGARAARSPSGPAGRAAGGRRTRPP